MVFHPEAYKYEPPGLQPECPPVLLLWRSRKKRVRDMKQLRRLREDESGVASTVGTIMALLVFLTFMSMIVNQYVPVWMKDAEASHMSGAFGQFGTFKGNVDLQMLAAQMAQNAGVHYIPITTYTAVTMGVDGVPIFAGSTVGDLNSYPNQSPWTTQFRYNIRGVTTAVNESSSGRINLEVYNRYFIRQSIIYENGAVVRWQTDGVDIKAEPTFEINLFNNSVQVSWTQISLFGQGGASGSTTEGILAKVIAVDRQDYSAITSDLWMNTTTPYGLGWVSFFNTTLANAFHVSQDAFKTCPPTCYARTISGGIVQDLSITTSYYKLQAVWKPSKLAYDVVADIFNKPALPITVVRVQHAFVNVAIAEKGSDVQI